MTRRRRPRDPAQLAKLIIDIASYQALPKFAALLTTGAGARAPPPIRAVERLTACRIYHVV